MRSHVITFVFRLVSCRASKKQLANKTLIISQTKLHVAVNILEKLSIITVHCRINLQQVALIKEQK